MSKFNKVLNSKIVLFIAVCVFLLTSTAYGIDLSEKSHLRKPLDFNNSDKAERYQRVLSEAAGNIAKDDGQFEPERKEEPGNPTPDKYRSFVRTTGILFIALLFQLLPVSGLASERSNLYEALRNKGISGSALNYLGYYTEISKKAGSITKAAYDLLEKKGISFDKKGYNVVFISEPAIEGRVIVLDEFDLMVIDFNQFDFSKDEWTGKELNYAKINKLAVLVAEGSSRLDAKDKPSLEQNTIANEKKLDAMSKLEMPILDQFRQEVISEAHRAIYNNGALMDKLGLSKDEFNKAMLEVAAVNENRVIAVVLKFKNIKAGFKEYRNYERLVFVFPRGGGVALAKISEEVNRLEEIDGKIWVRINPPFIKKSTGNYLPGSFTILPADAIPLTIEDNPRESIPAFLSGATLQIKKSL